MTNKRSIARRWATAVACALLWTAGTIPAAYADGETPPVTVVSPSPTPSATDPVVTDPVTAPGPVTDPIVTVPGQVTDPVVPDPAPVTDPVLTPAPLDPAVPTVPSADLGPAPAPTTQPVDTPALTAPAQVPAPSKSAAVLSAPNENVAAPETAEAVPAALEPSLTPSPSTVPQARAEAAPMGIPGPVAKSFDAVVATAADSPLYVQILTVLILLGAGALYFRVLGSKGTRFPSKSVK